MESSRPIPCGRAIRILTSVLVCGSSADSSQGSLRDGVVHDGKIQSTFGVNPKAKCKGLDCPDSSCVKCPRIKLELLRVAQPMEDHAAVWKRDDGKLCTMRRPQIQGLSNTIEVVSWKWLVKPVNRRKLQKYRRFRERKGAPVKHEVTATLIVDSRDADSGMKWEFAPPDYRWLQSGCICALSHSFQLTRPQAAKYPRRRPPTLSDLPTTSFTRSPSRGSCSVIRNLHTRRISQDLRRWPAQVAEPPNSRCRGFPPKREGRLLRASKSMYPTR